MTSLKAENDRISVELEKLRQRLKDEAAKVQAAVRLDLNLEKSRMRVEAQQQDAQIQETTSKVKTEVLALRAQMEGLKFDIAKYVIGRTSMSSIVFDSI